MPASFVIINIIHIGCCNCVDSNIPYFEIQGLLVTPFGSNNSVIDDGRPYVKDTINLSYTINKNCVAAERFKTFSIGFAYATTTCKCLGCGYNGFKSKIKSIVISSDSAYNGIPAGASLNNFFMEKETDGNNIPVYISIDSLKNRLNEWSSFDGFLLINTTKPVDMHGHKFTLTIQTEDNKSVKATTSRIYWF